MTEPPARILCLPVARCDNCGDELIAVFAVAQCAACLRGSALRDLQRARLARRLADGAA
jgi:hypothetical protein